MNKKQILLLVAVGLYNRPAFSTISLVYNLRVAEATKQRFAADTDPYLANITSFYQDRIHEDGTHHDALGSMGTIAYANPYFYIKTDFGFALTRRTHALDNFSRVQADDVLFTFGTSCTPHHRIKCAFSGLWGIPTHKDTGLTLPQFGYAHSSLGAQIDGDFVYSANEQHEIRLTTRFIHFFPRNTCIDRLERKGVFRFYLGDFLDFLIAHYSSFGNHGLEIGYNPETYLNMKLPCFPEAIRGFRCTRNIFYTNYNYRFSIKQFASAIGAGCSYAFESKSCPLNNKHIYLLWFSWGINF